jgi:glycosyltransferase involved in cell wall biosynthesis
MNAAPHIGLVAVGGAGWMGGANYVRNLAVAIRAAAPEARVSFVCGAPLVEDWRKMQPLVEVPFPPRGPARLWRDRTPLRAALDREAIDFLYPLTYDNRYNLGLQFPLAPQLGEHSWAGWIPDFQHRYLPALFSPEEIASRDENIAALVAEAPRVVFSSHSAAEDFRAYYPTHAECAEVLRFATPPIELAESAEDLLETPVRFLLVCNQFWKHKNHLVIFNALRLLRARGLRPLVLCTGQLDDYRDAACGERIRVALAQDGLGEQVHLLGLVPRSRQVALLRRAVAIIQPSLFEGWSTVVEDARVLGRPCLLSDLAVHREQDPPGARFFPASSAEALADLLAEAWNDWPAGPDPSAELAARALAETRLAEVGRSFLSIMDRCRAS